MPTYVYRREDGSTFEFEQRITEPALEVCPTTGQRVKRVISGAGLIFKGSGFYLTDYARNGSSNGKSSSASSSNGETSATTEKASEKPAASKKD
ncbi:MAG TPA: FmdB family zinc ribbon protein [Rhodothermales bacterium]